MVKPVLNVKALGLNNFLYYQRSLASDLCLTIQNKNDGISY